MSTISISRLLRMFPLVPRSRVRTDIRRGRLRLNTSEHRIGFNEEAVCCWANEWLSGVRVLDGPATPLIIHNRDAVILGLLEIEGSRGYLVARARCGTAESV